MSDDLRLREPERLAHDPELGRVIERANAEYGAALDEATAFRRLCERLAPVPPPEKRWSRVAVGLMCGLTAGALVIVLSAGVAFERRASRALVLGPELARAEGRVALPAEPEREAARAAESGFGGPAEREARGEAAQETGRAPLRTPERAPAPEGLTRRLAPPALEPQSAPAPQPPAPTGDAREDCLALARQGQARAAEDCFGERARGSGLSAEMALYEVARLRRDVLRDAPGALAALAEYRERFPRGSLRNEVDLSRVELLAESGQSREALQESAALLGTASGRERAAELHVLRGNVYRRDLGDLPAAALEYSQAERQGGSRGAEASRLRGACLEALGDVAGALQAYRRYASLPGQPHAAEVSRRIEQLSTSEGSAPP
jgi:hypothetical protein